MGLQITAYTVLQLSFGGGRITLDEILLQAENTRIFLPEQLKHLVIRVPFAILVDIEEPYIIAHHLKVVMKLLAVIGEPDEVMDISEAQCNGNDGYQGKPLPEQEVVCPDIRRCHCTGLRIYP